MHAIVTGAAGFIGSRLSQMLLENGWTVTGIDKITPYYDPETKRRNLCKIQDSQHFNFIEADVLDVDWTSLYKTHEVVFHLAGQPGVRASWGTTFSEYVVNNINVTQYMLENAVGVTSLRKFVYASTSSVYGDAENYPTTEDSVPKPVSPYGVTKLSAEHLCHLYRRNFYVPTVALRFFTVYGPGQRPDMAFHKILRAMYSYETFHVYGDGRQTRDFTYVDDIVRGLMDAGTIEGNYSIYNIGGGSSTSLLEVIKTFEQISGIPISVDFLSDQKGDARDTRADITRAKQDFGYHPQVSLTQGLRLEHDWFIENNRINNVR